jgi:hypothetical protein
MAYTETPKEKEKRLAYYAKNRANAKDKEDKADAETLRKFNETTNTDTSKNTNAMGDTYKKGGKVMKKKMKRFEEGGYTGDDEIVKYRMGMIDAKGNDLTKSKKETVEDNDPYGATKKETSADLDPYNAASKSSTSETPKKTAPKATPTPAPKAEPKVATKSSSWEDDSKIPALKTNVTNRVKANPTYTAPPKMDAADRVKKEREKAASKKTSSYTADHTMGNPMRSGGKVKSASARADGCAIRGKTRA